MDKRAILAVAGAGKTHHICQCVDGSKRNIILAFTNQNIANIRCELERKFEQIPENTIMMTFHSFRYNFMIRPFDYFIGDCYNKPGFHSEGVSISPSPQPMINGKYNPQYNKDGTLAHYCVGKRYYADRLSELILKTKKGGVKLIDLGCQNIEKFFDDISIDEMQDYRKEDWKVLEQIVKNNNQVTMVGDFYQHSVSGTNNHGTPFQKCKKNISYEEYKNVLKALGLEVDTSTLIKSRRCSKEICQFVSLKLGIEIESQETTNGKIIFLSEKNEIERVLSDDSIIKLVWNSSERYNFYARTWGYSKGDTYDSVCILLTQTFTGLRHDDFKLPASASSVNKLYVALTRSRGDVYIIEPGCYRKVTL